MPTDQQQQNAQAAQYPGSCRNLLPCSGVVLELLAGMQPHTQGQGTLHLAQVNIWTHALPTVLYGIYTTSEECAGEDVQLHFHDSSAIHIVVCRVLSYLGPEGVEGLLHYCCRYCLTYMLPHICI